MISPDGRYVALIEGSGWGDTCYVDSFLVVLQLDENGQVIYSHGLHHENLPNPENVYVVRLLEWLSPTQFTVELDWTCTTPNPKGVYLIDLNTQTTARINQ